jgi:FeS assembly SUF system regulator
MFRITKHTDYGIMLLARLAELEPGAVLTARDAADWSGLSVPMVSKILKSLVRHDIVVSRRGATGGYALANPPENTTVAEVIRALEGPISIVECGTQAGRCDQEEICPVRINWSSINSQVERALEQIPISEMVTRNPTRLLSLGASADESAGGPVEEPA